MNAISAASSAWLGGSGWRPLMPLLQELLQREAHELTEAAAVRVRRAFQRVLQRLR